VSSGLATSGDGRIIGASSLYQRGSMLLDRDHPWRRTLLIPHGAASDLAISPDGKWACSGSRGDSEDAKKVKVWSTATGEMVQELAMGNARVAFSPDSRWLGVGGAARYRFYKTGSWEAGMTVNHREGFGELPLAFHPSSRLVAVLSAAGPIVKFVDITSSEAIAALESPDPATIHYLEFSPDGNHIAVAKSDQRVELWDLSAIREQLESFGLAGKLREVFGAGEAVQPESAIDRIEVRGADRAGLRFLAARQTLKEGIDNFLLFFERGMSDPEELFERGNRWNRLGHWRQAAADYRASLSRRGDQANVADLLAWTLVVYPGRGSADEAIGWARKALELEAGNVSYTNTLGAALYRAGGYQEAAEVLERNVRGNVISPGYDWVFISMCHFRLGKIPEAREALALARSRKARERMNISYYDELNTLIREADALLDQSLPYDVFEH
jgi:tetratricopeptide (TPR) repeat protein